jgi:hypothetical protein
MTIDKPVGVTVHANKKWAFDFEIVVASSVLKSKWKGRKAEAKPTRRNEPAKEARDQAKKGRVSPVFCHMASG